MSLCSQIRRISMFSYFSSNMNPEVMTHLYILFGTCLVFLNFLLDGYTNYAQDTIVERFRVSSINMMRNTNIWRVIFTIADVCFERLIRRDRSELVGFYQAFTNCPRIVFDIQEFCVCACVGQIMIFADKYSVHVLRFHYNTCIYITVNYVEYLRIFCTMLQKTKNAPSVGHLFIPRLMCYS